MSKLYVALIHYPVVNKHGDVIASAVTNLDLHDIARALKTYGGCGFYVVTPLSDQQTLVERIVSHWTTGAGGTNHPNRRSALSLIHVADSLESACQAVYRAEGVLPMTVMTSARPWEENISFGRLRNMLAEDRPVLLVFGTAWGLSNDAISQGDYILEPIVTQTGYNHLSVRSAVAIVLDRLLGSEREHADG